jgi:hypothetical protein
MAVSCIVHMVAELSFTFVNYALRSNLEHLPLSTIDFCTLVRLAAGNTKGGSIIVQLTSCFNCLDWSVLLIKMNIVSCHTVDSKPVK